MIRWLGVPIKDPLKRCGKCSCMLVAKSILFAPRHKYPGVTIGGKETFANTPCVAYRINLFWFANFSYPNCMGLTTARALRGRVNSAIAAGILVKYLPYALPTPSGKLNPSSSDRMCSDSFSHRYPARKSLYFINNVKEGWGMGWSTFQAWAENPLTE